jgi:hypothetical protein
MGDKGLNQFTTGTTESFGATKVRRIGLYKVGVKVVLANQEAQLIAESRLAVAGTIGGMGTVRRRRTRGRFGQTRKGTQFLDRTEADAIGFAEGAIDSSSFGNAQLGAMH